MAQKMVPKSHISRAFVQKMFDGIRHQTTWNIDSDMLWGYFFADTRIDHLEAARRELEVLGYRFVDLYELERDGSAAGFMLHVEKVETHTVDSLDARNVELDALAAKYGVSYDGMDVGPAVQQAALRKGSEPTSTRAGRP